MLCYKVFRSYNYYHLRLKVKITNHFTLIHKKVKDPLLILKIHFKRSYSSLQILYCITYLKVVHLDLPECNSYFQNPPVSHLWWRCYYSKINVYFNTFPFLWKLCSSKNVYTNHTHTISIRYLRKLNYSKFDPKS